MQQIVSEIESQTESVTILVVEDEPVLRSSIVRGLSKLPDADVVSASSVSEARQLLKAITPRIILSDLQLPDGIGVEVLGFLRERQLHIPVIFVSAYTQSYRHQIPLHKDIEVFEKPVSLDMLRKKVQDKLQLNPTPEALPFSLVDYVQLACLGNHSIEILLELDGSPSGRILIVDGVLWSAKDRSGLGEEALRRVLFSEDTIARCRIFTGEPGQRDIFEHWEGVLLEAARIFDEADEFLPQINTVGNSMEMSALHPGPDNHDLLFDIDDDDEEQLLGMLNEVPSGAFEEHTRERSPYEAVEPAPPPIPLDATARRELFEEHYDLGIEKLLDKDFPGALNAFREADRLSPGEASVTANIQRLREMGYE